MNWANIGKNFISKFSEQPQAQEKNPVLEQTAVNSITSPSKTVQRSSTPKSPITDGERSLTRFLQNAGAIYQEVSSRAGVLESLKAPLKPLENKQIKLRLGENGKLTTKNRSRIAITSRIGGTKSKEAVKSVLAELEAASKLPNDPNNPQSVVKHLDDLLNNEWLCKTIADDPAEYKESILSILRDVLVGSPTVTAADVNVILSPLSGGNPETLVNEFEEGLMDYAYNLAETLRRENTDSFADAYNNVQTDVGQDVKSSFLESYHSLLEVIIQRK